MDISIPNYTKNKINEYKINTEKKQHSLHPVPENNVNTKKPVLIDESIILPLK